MTELDLTISPVLRGCTSFVGIKVSQGPLGHRGSRQSHKKGPRVDPESLLTVCACLRIFVRNRAPQGPRDLQAKHPDPPKSRAWLFYFSLFVLETDFVGTTMLRMVSIGTPLISSKTPTAMSSGVPLRRLCRNPSAPTGCRQ